MKHGLDSDTIEMLVLHVVAPGDTYGYDIAQQVQGRSQGQFDLPEGELYPVLHRMERQGLLETYWTQISTDRRRKFYRVTPEGQALLEARKEQWRHYASGVDGVLGTPQTGGFVGLCARIMNLRASDSTRSTSSTSSTPVWSFPPTTTDQRHALG